MAYNCKYRLDFSDVAERKRRVEILKKDYAGSVLPMIGTGEPVIIEWKSDDDFYEPLIGSQCTLNLMVTDSVTYDNFYEYDEREYQIVVYFEEAPNTWATYWRGFVTNDIYNEAIASTPYALSITATDGIGSLDGFNSWFPSVGESVPTLWQFIYHNMANLNLDFDFWISNDIRISSSSEWNNIFNDCTIRKMGYFKDNYILRDCKDVLRSILLGFNCKMFQCYGRWYIVNASSYGDQRIINGVQNGSLSGSGILSAKQGYLNGGTEEIKFQIWSYNGTYSGTVTPNMLRVIPSGIKPINDNMVRHIKRPVKKYQEIVDIKQQEVDVNFNASFEFDIEDWTIDTGTYGINAKPFAGLKSLFFIDVVSTPSTYQTKLHSSGSNAIVYTGEQYQLLTSVLFDNSATTNKLGYQIKVTDLITPANVYYWSESYKGWLSAVTWNEFSGTTPGKYESFKITTKDCPCYGTISIVFAKPYVSPVGSHVGTYIDNVAIRNIDKDQNLYEQIYYIREQNTSFITTDVLEHEGVYQADVDNGVFWGNFTNIDTFRRCNDFTNRTLEEIITQQRLNDFRVYCKTYEFDVYNQSQYNVLCMANKVYINFNTLTETDSAIMDSMRFAVKSNVYSVICHIPNNYTDVSSNYRVSFQ